MKIALIGYGKMGKAVESLARACGHDIVAIVDPTAQAAGAVTGLTAEAVAQADVCLEFTHPDGAASNVIRLCELGKRVVVGTTGWYDRLSEIASIVEKQEVAVLWGPNFSIGVNLFYKLVEHAAKLFGCLADRDFFVAETHHRAKADAPSGTAHRLGEIILAHSGSKRSIATVIASEAKQSLPVAPVIASEAKQSRPIRHDELQIVSTRVGWVAGVHRVGIESPHDSIVIEHRAYSRDGLAEGALLGAEWLATAPPGFYRFEDVLDNILTRRYAGS